MVSMVRDVQRRDILGIGVDVVTLGLSISLIEQWIHLQSSRYVCVSNVHMCMEAFDDPAFRGVLQRADLVVPDGKPIAVGLRLLGARGVEQIRGADLSRGLLRLAANRKLVVGLYGGTERAIGQFADYIERHYPGACVGCAISPPFRALDSSEDAAFVQRMNESGVQMLLVGLGCPKQEKWMADHKDKVNAVMVGVGAVFDFFSGERSEAPYWVRQIGMEWLFRLLAEPGRLWRRYLVLGPRFIWHFGKQLWIEGKSAVRR